MGLFCQLLLFVFVGHVFSSSAVPNLHVGSFNIQVFGRSKMSKPEVVDILLKTVSRYDLMLFMEIRDATGTAIKEFMEQLNQRVSSKDRYSMVISERLGRTSSKEQYAYLYRANKMMVKDIYQHADEEDYFERPPYAARFQLFNFTNVKEIAVMGIHTTPSDVFNEVNHLHGVYKKLQSLWKMDEFIVFGDFNADCTYLSWRKFDELQFAKDSSAFWLIEPCHRTTMVSTSCIYDHIIVTGNKLKASIVPHSNQVHYFDKEHELSEQEAGRVSDHFPVEFKLTDRPSKLESQPVYSMVQVKQIIYSKQHQFIKQIRQLYLTSNGDQSTFGSVFTSDWTINIDNNNIYFSHMTSSDKLENVLLELVANRSYSLLSKASQSKLIQLSKAFPSNAKLEVNVVCGNKLVDHCIFSVIQ